MAGLVAYAALMLFGVLAYVPPAAQGTALVILGVVILLGLLARKITGSVW